MRRSMFVDFPSLATEDKALVRSILGFFGATKAGLNTTEVTSDEFVSRLIRAGNCELGTCIEIIQDATSMALSRNADGLLIEHFANAFDVRTGCGPSANIFTIKDWWAIEARAGG